MRLALSLCLGLTAVLGASAQTRSFGSVVFPGGTSATNPGISRNFGSVVFPGGGTTGPIRTNPGVIVPPGRILPPPPRVGVQQGRQNSFRNQTGGSRNFRGMNGAGIYSYPIYVPSYYDSQGYYDTPPPGEPGYFGSAGGLAPQPAAPNITVVYPPPQPPHPVVIEVGPDGQQYIRQFHRETPPAAPETAPTPAADNTRYMLAFKDHTVYTAVAYWFDGDTLHYFTNGNTHNQASLSLLDRELTERLNRELGIDFRMPPAK